MSEHVASLGRVGTDRLAESDRRAVESVRRAMERLGFEITTIRPEPGFEGRWQVHWQAQRYVRTARSFGASGATALAAARAALTNAMEAMSENTLSEDRCCSRGGRARDSAAGKSAFTYNS
jgi:hypothetical protein